MPKATTKTFKSGNSEAVRLPRDLAFGVGTELILERSGDVVTIRPKANGEMQLPEWRKKLLALVNDLEALPKPSSIQKRAQLHLPKRKGL